MNVIDIILLVLLGLAVFKGIKDGFVRQVGGIAGLIMGIFLAGRFSAMLSSWLHQWINASESIVKAISFVLIIILACICMHIVGLLLEKVIKISMLGWLNRLLGVALAVFGVILLSGVLLSLIQYVNTTWFVIIPQDVMAKSEGIKIITSISDAVFPYIKSLFKV